MQDVLKEVGNLKVLELQRKNIEAAFWTDKSTVENILMKSKDLAKSYSDAAGKLYNAWSAEYKDSQSRVDELGSEVSALKKQLATKAKRESRPPA